MVTQGFHSQTLRLVSACVRLPPLLSRTYSAAVQSRTAFGTGTAIRPDGGSIACLTRARRFRVDTGPPFVRLGPSAAPALTDDATAGFRETVGKHERPKTSLER